MGRAPGRPLEGWTLYRAPSERNWRVVFTVPGRGQVKPSTGTDDEDAARRLAPSIYARHINGDAPVRRARQDKNGERSFAEVGAAWLKAVAGTLDVKTRKTYAGYIDGHLNDYFGTFEAVSTDSARSYALERLKHVKGKSVSKELSVLRQIVQHELGDGAPLIPGVKKRVLGTPHPQGKRTRTKLSPEEARAIIAELPEMSRPRGKHAHRGAWPVRARIIVAYETGLRPATLDALSVPEHYTKGASELVITDEMDKARFGRTLPLSDEARAALDAVARKPGLIFGVHDYRDQLERAAARCVEKTLLPEHKAKTFHMYDLRAARITHWTEETDNVTGVQYLAGHTSLATTAKYVKPTERAARAVLATSQQKRNDAVLGHDLKTHEKGRTPANYGEHAAQKHQ